MKLLPTSVLLSGLVASTYSGVIQRAPSCPQTVIVQMFEWTWDSIAAECTSFLGPAGYGFVQASPAQEHIMGPQWWTDYQPVSYILTSKRGNRQQYQNMIDTCHAVGVKVIADTIFNHMAGIDSGTGVAGSTFTHYNYPGIYSTSNFHHCGLTPDDNIANYQSAAQVQTCELVNLADLATEQEYVRARLAQYANDLLSLGVDGLRLDAAKHIAATDIANITSRFSKTPYLTLEVIFGNGEPITPSMYTYIGDVQEFRYTSLLKSAFSGSGISQLQNLDSKGWIASSVANVFVANHDTERNGYSLNANSPSNTYTLAHVFSLAHPYGTPTVLSSYSGFTNTDAGAPNSGVGTCSGNGGTNGWYCQHRFKAIAGMVGFRNQVGTAPLVNWVSPNSQQIAFGRGAVGFVAINNLDSSWTTTFSTSLPAGSYCDVVGGVSSSGMCTGATFNVGSSRTFTATIPARSAIAIHAGALGPVTSSTTTSSLTTSSSTTITSSSTPMTSSSTTMTSSSTTSVSSTTSSSTTAAPPSGSVSVQFLEKATTVVGENIFLLGSLSQLGNWNPKNAIPLSSAAYPTWAVTLNLPSNTAFQYKFVKINGGGSLSWESDPNRFATTPASGTLTLSTTWR